jgi:hypothetical protein
MVKKRLVYASNNREIAENKRAGVAKESFITVFAVKVIMIAD